jgi:Zn-finger nucleic acid-binding protein
MEPYRTSGFRCPTCPESPLREFHNRLICDECNGILLDEPDFVASCEDIVSKDFHLELGKEATTTHACPRCERALTAVTARLAPLKLRVDVLRCAAHGLWFKDGQLTSVFAQIGLFAHGMGVSREGGGTIGLDGLPMRRHGPASGALVISDWSNRPRRRTPTATPINLYRDQRLACPACTTTELRFFGDRYACAQCNGTFVQNAALEAMVMDMSGQPWDLPLASGSEGTRACPVCTRAMLVDTLERVPIDRCAEHGVWFDPNELTVTLENASHKFDPRGVRIWIKKLFT